MRIIAHTAMPYGCQRRQFAFQHALSLEDLLGAIALHPAFEDPNMFGLIHVAHRDLMTTPVILAFFAVDLRRTSPSLGRPKNYHWPDRTRAFESFRPSITLNSLNLREYLVQRLSHQFVHFLGIATLDEI